MRILPVSAVIMVLLMGCQPDQKQDPAVASIEPSTANTDKVIKSAPAILPVEEEVAAVPTLPPEPVCEAIGWDEILADAEQIRTQKEEFSSAGATILAYEYSGDFTGQYDKLFRFDIIKDNCVTAVISVGSYAKITESERALGRISSTERIFHFDAYELNGHEAFGLSRRQPAYSQAKKFAILSAPRYQ